MMMYLDSLMLKGLMDSTSWYLGIWGILKASWRVLESTQLLVEPASQSMYMRALCEASVAAI